MVIASQSAISALAMPRGGKLGPPRLWSFFARTSTRGLIGAALLGTFSSSPFPQLINVATIHALNCSLFAMAQRRFRSRALQCNESCESRASQRASAEGAAQTYPERRSRNNGQESSNMAAQRTLISGGLSRIYLNDRKVLTISSASYGFAKKCPRSGISLSLS